MRTAVSIPDCIFKKAERLARRMGMSRSELYARALHEYLARHAPGRTRAQSDPFVAAAARRILERTEW